MIIWKEHHVECSHEEQIPWPEGVVEIARTSDGFKERLEPGHPHEQPPTRRLD